MSQAFATTAANLAKAADVCDELEKYAGTGTTGILATAAALKAALAGDQEEDAALTVDSIVATVGDAVGAGAVRSLLDPIIRELSIATEVRRPSASVEEAYGAVVDYMAENAETINAGGDTYDTSETAVGTGDGVMYRLTVDQDGYPLAGLDPDVYTVECVGAALQSGRSHDERFQIRGRDARPDNLDLTGSGIDPVTFTALGVGQSELLNPGFDSATFSGSTISALAGWRTAADGDSAVANTGVEIDSTNYFRVRPNAVNNYGLKITADGTVYQDPTRERQARISLRAPYLVAVRWRRNDAATGTLTLRVGATVGSGGVSASVSIGSITDGTWATLLIPMGTGCWPANWDETNLKFQVTVASLATGTVTIDDCQFERMTRFGAAGDQRTGRGSMGQYVAWLGGATPSVVGDTHTFTDSEGARGVIGYWLRKAARGYMPALASASTLTAAGGRTFTFAASGKTLTLSSGDLTSDGFADGMLITVGGTSSNNGTFKALTVTATVITFVSTVTIVDEGPLSATATIVGSSTITDA